MIKNNRLDLSVITTDILLKKEGIFFIEDPYIFDIIKKTSFDQIYDEHIYLFSGLSISKLAERFNMQLVDMIHQDVHGGSMRYYLKKGSSNQISENVNKFIAQEKEHSLDNIDGYLKFKDQVNKICSDLQELLNKLKNKGHKIVGYGATAKSSTLLNYAQIGPELINYITDTTTNKINKYTPGSHIPIRSYETFLKDNVSYVLLLAWNHKEEIYEKEKNFRQNQGKFITYFPQVTIE